MTDRRPAVRAADSVSDVLSIIGEQALRALDASRVTIGQLDLEERALDVLINVGDLGAGDEIRLVGIELSELHSDDFIV